MYEDVSSIDVAKLRKDMEGDALGAFFGGGFGGGLIEEAEIKRASDEELIKMAKRQGINLSRYRK